MTGITNPNPSQLLPHFLANIGLGNSIPPSDAVMNWNENPYIPETANWAEYNTLMEAREFGRLRPYMKLPDVPITPPAKRRLAHPILRMDFTTLHDIRLRLAGTIIYVGGELFLVSEVFKHKQDFLLILQDRKGQQYKAFYNETPQIDLRTPDPQYFMMGSMPAYLSRPPARQNRQGLSHESLAAKPVGSHRYTRVDIGEFLKGMCLEDVLAWSESYQRLLCQARALQALRLSKTIAVYRNNEDGVTAEFRGRSLGELKEDTILVDEIDAQRPWILREAAVVGCKVKSR